MGRKKPPSPPRNRKSELMDSFLDDLIEVGDTVPGLEGHQAKTKLEGMNDTGLMNYFDDLNEEISGSSGHTKSSGYTNLSAGIGGRKRSDSADSDDAAKTANFDDLDRKFNQARPNTSKKGSLEDYSVFGIRLTRTVLISLLCGVCAIIAIVTGVIIAVTGSSSSADSPSSLPMSSSETQQTIMAVESMNAAIPSNIESELRINGRFDAFGEAIEPTIGKSIYDDSTHEHETLLWLANDDPLQLDVTSSQDDILQRFAAANLYFATNGNEWTCDNNFLSEKGVCDWNGGRVDSGIFCNNEDGTLLTDIRLGDCELIGTIPNSIGLLSNMGTLDVSSNELVGSIPTSIGMMSLLTTIDMSNNYLIGEIPATIEQLSELNTLNLSHNNLHGGDGSKAIIHLPNLEAVNLSHNHLNGRVGHLGNSDSLRNINLSSNLIHGTIPNGFGAGKSLESLDLSDNRITGTIPKSIANLENLIELDLSGNQFSGSLPSALQELSPTETHP